MRTRRDTGAWAAAVLAVLAAGACGRTPEPPPAAPSVTAPAPPVAATPDTGPKAAEAAAGTSTHEYRPDPLRPMTKNEEAMAMPKAGQANDHSNPAAQPVPTPPSEPAR